MLNAEKYKKELIENIKGNDYCFHFNKHTHEIKKCKFSDCSNCSINEARDGRSCFVGAVAWLLSEYKEPIELSRLEYETLKYFYKVKEYRYIVRGDNGLIWLGFDKPHKIRTMWASNKPFGPFPLFGELFKFVRLSDKEPTSIKDVLDNCEVVEDDL